MGKDGKENIDKNKKIPDAGSEENELLSLKKELKSENIDKNNASAELLKLKKDVEEKNITNTWKERLSSLAKGIKEKKNTVSAQNEVLESNVNSDSGKSGFLSKQIAIFSSRKEKNISRPIEGIESAYTDVANQIEEGTKDPNIIARGLAKLIKLIIQNEK